MKKVFLFTIALVLGSMATVGVIGAVYHLVCEIVNNCQA